MKKIIFILIFTVIIFAPITSIATETIDTEAIFTSQKESVDIQKFLSESQKYTQEVFKDTDLGDLLNDAITGNINNSNLVKNILDIIGKETLS